MSKAERAKKYREKHREDSSFRRRRARYSEEYRRRYPERFTPETRRRERLRTKWGMTPEQYAALLQRQNGGCALCFRPPKNRPLHVDHDHKTGMIRGLLCHRCNRGLGYIFSPDVLARAVDYVQQVTGMYLPTKKKRPHKVKRREWKERPSRNRKSPGPIPTDAPLLHYALAELVPALPTDAGAGG
jgi:hypothetical protein